MMNRTKTVLGDNVDYSNIYNYRGMNLNMILFCPFIFGV